MKVILEKFEKLIVRIGGPIGGLVAGIIAGIYGYTLLDLSILVALAFVPLGFIVGLIWASKFVLFAEPILIIAISSEGGSEYEMSGSCMFQILRIMYLLATLAVIPLAIFEPTWLIWTAIIHGVYTIYMLFVDPIGNKRA